MERIKDEKVEKFLYGSGFNYVAVVFDDNMVGKGVSVNIGQYIYELNIFRVTVSNNMNELYEKKFTNYKDALNEFNKIEINENYFKENEYLDLNRI